MKQASAAYVKLQHCNVHFEFAPNWKIQTIFLAYEELDCLLQFSSLRKRISSQQWMSPNLLLLIVEEIHKWHI